MRAPACLALLLLSACSFPIKATVPSEELTQRRPENRSGIMVGDELLRVSWLPPLSTPPQGADPAQFAGVGDGSPVSWLIASRSASGRAVFSFAGHPHAWRSGLIDMQDDLWPALTAARNGSAFHAPVQARLGGDVVWAIGDLVPAAVLRPGGETLVTVELYAADPRQGGSRPLTPISVMVTARRSPSGEEVKRPPGNLTLISRPDGFFSLGKVERSREGQLTSLDFTAWRPDMSAVMAGQVAGDVIGAGHARELVMERMLTDALVEWKTRQLPAWLASADRERLDLAVISAEKGMLQLDLKSRIVKDEIDSAARQGAGSQPALTEKAQLLDQRKTLIGAVLGSLKSARDQAR